VKGEGDGVETPGKNIMRLPFGWRFLLFHNPVIEKTKVGSSKGKGFGLFVLEMDSVAS
jgi:hypothetical protein